LLQVVISGDLCLGRYGARH
jgi:hypothetical protein